MNHIESELKELDRKIDDLRRRMPAHSASPSMMMELEGLEEKRDELRAKLEKLKKV